MTDRSLYITLSLSLSLWFDKVWNDLHKVECPHLVRTTYTNCCGLSSYWASVDALAVFNSVICEYCSADAVIITLDDESSSEEGSINIFRMTAWFLFLSFAVVIVDWKFLEVESRLNEVSAMDRLWLPLPNTLLVRRENCKIRVTNLRDLIIWETFEFSWLLLFKNLSGFKNHSAECSRMLFSRKCCYIISLWSTSQ